MAQRLSFVDDDVDPVALATDGVAKAAKRAPDIPALRGASRAERVSVEPDAGRREKETSSDIADVDLPHPLTRDDPRRLQRLQRYWDRVRDVHHAAEGQDAEDDACVHQRRGRRGDRPIAAGNDRGVVSLTYGGGRELRGCRMRNAGLHERQLKSRVLESGADLVRHLGERNGAGTPSAGAGIRDEKGTHSLRF